MAKTRSNLQVTTKRISSSFKVYSDINGNVTSIGINNPFGYAITGGGEGDIIAILIR